MFVKLVTAGRIIYIDESLFQVKRKYNRRRLIFTNDVPRGTDNTEIEDDDDDNIRIIMVNDF